MITRAVFSGRLLQFPRLRKCRDQQFATGSRCSSHHSTWILFSRARPARRESSPASLRRLVPPTAGAGALLEHSRSAASTPLSCRHRSWVGIVSPTLATPPTRGDRLGADGS